MSATTTPPPAANPSDTQQYLRNCSLLIGPAAGGQALELAASGLRVVFKVKHADVQTPTVLIARVYNLSLTTAQTIMQKFAPTTSPQVILSVSYGKNPPQQLFIGQAFFYRFGRENATDTYFEITAADGDQFYNFGAVNQSLAAGWTQKDLNEAVNSSLAQNMIVRGYTAPLSTQAAPRGKVLYGQTRDILRDQSKTTGTTWQIQDGKLVTIANNSTLPGDAVVLTRYTGMIGLPQQTQQGIQVRALINSQLRPGRVIKLDNSAIQLQAQAAGYSQEANAFNAFLSQVTLNPGGFYRVLVADFEGDTRGTPWYVDLICINVDGTIPPGFDVKNLV